MLVWTLVWALAEVGIEFWALLPRLAVPFVLALWMLTPRFRAGLRSGLRNLVAGRFTTAGFVVAFAAIVAVGFARGD